MGHGLTVERTDVNHVRVFDSACQWSTVYVLFEGLILCESGIDHSKYRYAVRELLDEKTDGSVSTYEIYRRAGVRQ
jgi:hypothetical protein